MKRLCIVLLCLLLAVLWGCGPVEPEEVLTTALFGAETTTEAPPLSPTEIRELESGPYASVLNSFIERYYQELDGHHYAMYDFDGDGIDELLMEQTNDIHESHRYYFYALENGVAVEQEEYCDTQIPLSVYVNGTMKGLWNKHASYLRFENGALVMVTRLFCEPGSGFGDYSFYSPKISSKRTPMTQAEYERAQKDLQGNGKTVELNWKSLFKFENERGPYADVLGSYAKACYGRTIESNQFALYDIDGNGTKELLLAENSDYNGIRLYSIYTIQDGVAVLQKAFFPLGEGLSIPPSLIFKNGTIMFDNGFDERRLNYYRFEAGELKFQGWLVHEANAFDWENNVYSDEFYRVYPNDMAHRTPITKEEFERLQKEFEGDGQTVELDWKPLAAYAQPRKD